MQKFNLECSFGWKTFEDQIYIFTNCQPIKVQLSDQDILNYDHIYSDVKHQQKIIKIFI